MYTFISRGSSIYVIIKDREGLTIDIYDRNSNFQRTVKISRNEFRK